MELKIKFKCTCGCSYTMDEHTNAKEVVCPNCGKVVTESNKFISIFKIANEIKQPDIFEQEVYFQVTSFSEELNDSQ